MTNTQKEIPSKIASLQINNKEDMSQQETTPTNKTTGSPRSGSPGNRSAVRGIEDIWNEPLPGSALPGTERYRNGQRNTLTRTADVPELSSDDDAEKSVLGNGESKAGFINRRPSMTAELEPRIRQVRLSEGPDTDKHPGPNSPATGSKWGMFGMNWNTTNAILGERTSPPQDQNQPPISPLARFQQSPFDPPAERRVSPPNVSPGFSTTRSRFAGPQPVDPNQRVQRSQSFSVGDNSGFPSNYLSGQTAPVGHRSSLFAEDQPPPSAVGTRHFKTGSHAAFPASPLARAPIAEEADEFDAAPRQNDSKEGSPSRYQDRGRSLSTSAASHGYARQRVGEAEDVIDELYEEEDDSTLQDFEPLSRSRTLPADTNISAPISGLGFGGSRYQGLTERQRGPRQSPRIVEEIPATRRTDSFSQTTWDESRAHRSPPRPVDYPSMQSSYDSYDNNSIVDSPASMHSFPGIRDYSVSNDVQNYFNNDADRRLKAETQFQYYQMQNRFSRYPTQYPQPHDPQVRPYADVHNPDNYTLHIVKFKANRMDVFYLAKEKKLDLKVKDYVIVDGDRGTDLGMVSKVNVTEAEARALTAQLQREQAAATAANQNGMNANAMEAIAAAASQVNERDVTIPKKFIHRLAVKGEIDQLQMKMQDEAQAKQVCEMKVQQRGLQMDILDVEYQWCFPSNDEADFRDRRKLYIYFIAPQRVDFVALVKDLFKIYKTRIWLHNSTASHVTSQLAAGQTPFLQSTPQNAQDPTHDYAVPHLQPQYEYYRTQPRHSPGQQQYLPMQQPMYSTNIGVGGGYYSPPQQQYFPPASRIYPPPPPPQHHMPFQSSGQQPPGQW